MVRETSIAEQAEERAAAGDLAAAERLCREALDADPADLRALSLSARLASRSGDREEEAVRNAREAVRHAPEDIGCRKTLAQALAATGALAEAIASVEAALALDPGDLWCRCELGRYLLAAGRPDEAIATLEAARKSAPNRPEPTCNLALVLFRLKRTKDAVAAAKQALALGETRASELGALGKYLLDANLDANTVREARIAFERAIRGNPDDLDSRSGLFRACGILGDKAAASEAVRESFRRCPVYVRETGDSVRRILVLEYLYHGFFKQRRYGAEIFSYMNFVSGLEPGVLSLHHYYLNRDDPVGDLKRLGRFDAVINNLSNGERLAELGLSPLVREVIDAAGAPALNPPEAVLATTRAANYQRLREARGFTFPKTVTITVGTDGLNAAFEQVITNVPPPVILRPITSHLGARAVLARDSGEVRAAMAGFAGEEIYAIAYRECRDPDGVARRYRLIGIGGELVPANMHASHHWNVHGDTRIDDDDWQARGLDREELAFLEDPACVIGGDPAEVFRDLTENTPLDIYGFDFTIAPKDGVIVFEVNSSMRFWSRRMLRRYPYLRPYKERSQRMIEAYIEARIRAENPDSTT